MRLSQRDLRVLQQCILTISDHRDLSTFPGQVLAVLRQVICADHASYNTANLHTRHTEVVLDPPDLYVPGSDAIHAVYCTQQPVLNYHQRTGNSEARTISDFLTRQEFHRLDLYNELYRWIGVEYQIAIPLPAAPQQTIGIALSRSSKNFSERDRACLNILRPHIRQALAHAEAVSRLQHDAVRLGQELAALQRGVIFLRDDGSARAWTDRAAQWVQECFEPLSSESARLPEEVRQWVRHQQALATSGEGIAERRAPLRKEGDGKRLVIRLMDAHTTAPYLVLEEEMSATPAALERSLNLTPREAEVLFWVAKGSSNEEVAVMLGQSRRTVQKHLEHIYDKLGVESRGAAAYRALGVLGVARKAVE